MEMMSLVVEIRVPARIQHEKTQKKETEDENFRDREGAEHWYCRVPFPGVKYYFYHRQVKNGDTVKDTGSCLDGERGAHRAI